MYLTVAIVCALCLSASGALGSALAGGAVRASAGPARSALAGGAVRASAGPAAASAAAATSCAGEHARPSTANGSLVEAATLCLIDAIRAQSGLRALRANRELGGVATSQVRTMVRTDYFADDRPSGQTPISLVGVTHYPAHAAAIAVGQNIAWGTGADTTPAHIVAAWMASPGHRAVILTSQYRDAGVAITPSLPRVLRMGSRGATYAVEFADRR